MSESKLHESIYIFVVRHTKDDKYDGELLPDDDKISEKYKLKGIHLAPGLLDDYQGETDDMEKVKKICDLLEAISAGEDKKEDLYQEILSSSSTLSLVDAVLVVLSKRGAKMSENLQNLAQWLIRESRDREPLKFGIFLCGVVGGDIEPVLQMALCEEFSLFSGIALIKRAKGEADIERILIDIASKLEGWGKIQIVRIMTEYLELKNTDWFLYEGWKNNIGPQVALRCAVVGKLDQAVATADPDRIIPLIEELIPDLGSQGKSLDDYEHSVFVLKNIIERLEREQLQTIDYLLFASRILEYLSEKEISEESKKLGWSDEIKKELIELYQTYISRKGWEGVTKSIIAGDDLDLANRVARILGIDVWEKNFNYLSTYPEKARTEDHLWFNLMRNNNKERALKVLDLALKVLPLDQFCTGPDSKTEFQEDIGDARISFAISAILQIIQPFSGMGADLLSKSVNSPTVRDRNMSLNVIEKWDLNDLKRSPLIEVLEDVIKKEPEQSVKERIEKVLTNAKL